MRIEPAEGSVADWILHADLHWWNLVTLGPPGYPAYGRLRFIPDPTYPYQPESSVSLPADHLNEDHQLALALRTLAGHTDTPVQCYLLVWDGWGDDAWTRKHAESLTKVSLPTGEREYHLGRAPLTELITELSPEHVKEATPLPGFVWPADRSWCLTSDVDPHWAGIAASDRALQALVETPDLDVVWTHPEAEHLFYV
ncbi:hypothetical protein [Nesterenkonia alkaliphila]|uniref:Uncharacterized protein n=1 Tax=Nesterenkonia alkaliphila TaxID=1463631 RepID=A0A7K1UKJ3_9MICC|nr:hypothetical protein [Nesterenkonia alkaliphila]MVT27017.1 hypothetical protein [Nesterenkonia alkaliphila]GFZ94123.1 hypothetical protein GCM10011359_24560 [Nesterenkonia alkaliphila]